MVKSNCIFDFISFNERILIFILVTIITLAMYYSTFDNGFILNDFFHIEKASKLSIKHLLNADEFTSNDYFWWFKKGVVVRYFRPMVSLTNHMYYRFWGVNARGHHIGNVFMHLFTVLIFTSLAFKVVKRRSAALIASLIFALHPCHNEAIEFMAAGQDIIAGLFFLASFAAYVYFRQKGYKWAYILTIVTFILALSSKEITVTLPIILILYDIILNKENDRKKEIIRKNVRIYIPFIIIVGLYFIFYFLFLGKSEGLNEPYFHHPLKQGFILIALYKYLLYLIHFMVCNFFHPIDNMMFWRDNLIFLFPFFIGATVLYLLVFKYVIKDRRARFFFVWILITLLPTTLVMMAQRQMYIPSIGFCMFLGIFFERFPNTKTFSFRMKRVLVAGILIFMFSYYITINYISNDIFKSLTLLVRNSLNQIREQIYHPSPNSQFIFINTGIITAGFLKQALHLLYNNSNLKVHVLTVTQPVFLGSFIIPKMNLYLPFDRILSNDLEMTGFYWKVHDDYTVVVGIKEGAYFSSAWERFVLWRPPFKEKEVIEGDDFNVIVNQVVNNGVKEFIFKFNSPITEPKNIFFFSNGNKIERMALINDGKQIRFEKWKNAKIEGRVY